MQLSTKSWVDFIVKVLQINVAAFSDASSYLFEASTLAIKSTFNGSFDELAHGIFV